jgi:hypothetical protein
MIKIIVENKEYQRLQSKQIKEQLMLLVGIIDDFSLIANIDAITFDPQLPKDIIENLEDMPMFSFANYTFESIVLTEEYISFETGFGKNNIGSVVKIPYIAIFQILIDYTIIYLNPAARMVIQKKEEVNQIKRSMNAFALNTKNKSLLD